MKNALVIAAHPDDEVLGCGGTIARMADEGWSVSVLILAEGATSRDRSRNRPDRADEVSALAECAARAARILGARDVELADFPDNRMDGVERLDIVKRVEHAIQRVGPSRVLTHRFGDVNVDHDVVHQAVAAACRPTPDSRVAEVLYFEVPSSTEWRFGGALRPFAPDFFVDIDATLARKLQALEAYASEMRPFPHPRSIAAVEHLARWRGAMVGRAAAEAFELGRRIE